MALEKRLPWLQSILSDVWLESEVCLLARVGRPRLSSHMLPNIWVSDGGHT